MQQDENRLRDSNVERSLARADKILRAWSTRRLSTLGKILLLKTFGISQLIFLMQSFCFEPRHFKTVNALLYKFIWNRHYLAAKAPERIKREILNTPINLGGLGMLDVEELDKGIKLKAYGRLLTSQHPFLSLIKNGLAESYFFPKCSLDIDSVTRSGLETLHLDRWQLLLNENIPMNRKVLATLREIKLKQVVKIRARDSIMLFNLRNQGLTTVGQVSERQLEALRPIAKEAKVIDNLKQCLIRDQGAIAMEASEVYYGDKILDLRKATSKEIRTARVNRDPICLYKLGAIMTPLEVENWSFNLRKVSSVRHKNTLLRVAHGEVYSKEKLTRFGLIRDPTCPRCGLIEDLRHKIMECEYTKRIWKIALEKTNPEGTQLEVENRVLGAFRGCKVAKLTLHAELLGRIISLRDDLTYVVRPRSFVENALHYLIKKEKNREIKSDLEALLV